MTTEEIQITFYGNFGRQISIQKQITELSLNYKVSQVAKQKFSSFNGNDVDPLNLIIQFASPLIDKLKDSILEQVALNLLLNPLMTWLEKVETGLDNPIAESLVLKFQDITINIGYSRKNHINALGITIQKLPQLKKLIQELHIGNINRIVTPVKTINNEWQFSIPKNDENLNVFIENWGVELDNANCCIYNIKDNVIYYETWNEDNS